MADPHDDDYTVGVLCALLPEAVTVQWMLDQSFANNQIGDKNEYTVYTGRIGHQNVVIQWCKVGKKNAAEGRSALLRAYKKIEIVFVVGIAGGVPTYKSLMNDTPDVILGDVAISTEILPHDEISKLPNGGMKIRTNPTPLKEKLDNFTKQCAVGDDYEHLESKMHEIMRTMGRKLEKKGKNNHIYPGVSKDVLYKPTYHHMHDVNCAGCQNGTCEKLAWTCTKLECDERERIERDRLKEKTPPKPAIHFGTVASGDSVM